MLFEKSTIKKAKNGDTKSLEKLYRENVKCLYRFVRFKVNTNEEAEDITSEAFVKAFEKISSFKGGSSFKSWLYTIAKNLVYDSYNKNKNVVSGVVDEVWENLKDNDELRMKPVPMQSGNDELNQNEEAASYKLQASQKGSKEQVPNSKDIETQNSEHITQNQLTNEDLVRNILNNLKEDYREVLELRFIMNYSLKETAEALGKSVGNIKVIQNRAIRKAKSITNYELRITNEVQK